MNFHFDMLKFILQIMLQINSALRFLGHFVSTLSFDKFWHRQHNDKSQISFMYNTNNNGSIIQPCSTPDVTCKGDGTVPSIITD